jgi:hypothetical protein
MPRKAIAGLSLEARAARFWAKVTKDGPIPEGYPDLGPCWVWRGPVNPYRGGYGVTTVLGKPAIRAHRVAYELTFGPIPEGLWVLHRCDTPPCCNPAHLFLGTHADNMADMRAKGRSAAGDRNGMQTHPERHARRIHPELAPKGEANPRAKLSEVSVRQIRALRAAGAPFTALAVQFGVSESAIRNAVTRKTWCHVD